MIFTKMRARIMKEIELLYNDYGDVHSRYNQETQSHEFTISNKYQFSINNHYPFTSPENIVICGQLWHEFTRVPRRFIKFLLEIHKKDCFCCGAIVCPQNWGPGYRLNRVIKEFISFQDLRKRVFYAYMIDRIKEKYNVPDEMDIMGYLL